MATSRRLRRLFWAWFVPLLGVAALGLALWAYYYQPRERVFHLRMTAGSAAGARHELAEILRDEVASSGVVLELHGSRGSEEALDWVNERKIDCAFIQGGLSVGARPNVVRWRCCTSSPCTSWCARSCTRRSPDGSRRWKARP